VADRRKSETARLQCARLAMSPADAIDALGMPGSAMRSFAADHAERLSAARARVELAGNSRMGGGADIDLLYSLCVKTEARRVLETGVAFGWSSLVILSAIEGREGARLVSVDMPYLGANLDHLVGLAVPGVLKANWSLRRGADQDQLENAIAEIEPIDLAHYDSDKSARGRLWAYSVIWRALRPGGILMSDDIGDNHSFLKFASDVGVAPLVVSGPDGEKFSGILRKAA
jgi:predicted O-methyltransferase YrrM